MCYPVSVVGSDFVLGLVKLTPMSNYLQAGFPFCAFHFDFVLFLFLFFDLSNRCTLAGQAMKGNKVEAKKYVSGQVCLLSICRENEKIQSIFMIFLKMFLSLSLNSSGSQPNRIGRNVPNDGRHLSGIVTILTKWNRWD